MRYHVFVALLIVGFNAATVFGQEWNGTEPAGRTALWLADLAPERAIGFDRDVSAGAALWKPARGAKEVAAARPMAAANIFPI